MDDLRQMFNDSCSEIVIIGGLPPKDNYCTAELWALDNNCPFENNHV